MKKIILFIFSSVLLIGLFSACSNPKESNNTTSDQRDVREVVYNQLKTKDKELIKGTWKDGEMRKITLTEIMGNISDKSYIGKEVYLIDFPTKSISEPNNMIVYASLDDYKFIDYGLVD